MIRLRGVLLAAAVAFEGAHAAPPDVAQARAAFEEARQASDKDGGALWGKRLYGPMMFVDPQSMNAVANEPDAQGVLHGENGVYAGVLPKEILPANTAFMWQGKRWTMVEWPLWGDAQTRARLLTHELYHRIQPDLGFSFHDLANSHLDTLEGRLWLQLEWRALATALAETGKARLQAVRDALAFRAYRHHLFPDAAQAEQALEINEGLAEYTGVRLSSPDEAAARWLAIQKLVTANEKTWVRSFPYISGPAYGLLLDAYAPRWRAKLNDKSDIAAMLATTLPKNAPANAAARASLYGEASLRLHETERAAEADAVKAKYRAKLVEGSVLMLPNMGTKFNVSFDPRELVPLGEAGTVYPTMQASDEWGNLASKEGALMPINFQRVTVAAPENVQGSRIVGPGWTLDLSPGWKIVPGEKPGSYTVRKD